MRKFLLLFCSSLIYGQGFSYLGPDDPAGDIEAEREGYMNGNRVYTYFRNTTELADWPTPNVSKWPNNPDGTQMLDGLGLLVGAKVYIEDDLNDTTIDTIPISDLTDIENTPHHILYYLQTSYREEMDTDPTGTVEWGFYPIFGYFNPNSEYPAMSTLPSSWPSAGWPSRQGLKWPGEWDGRFGRGITYADLETYFVVNDAHDQEYLGLDDMVKYYPRGSQKKIGQNITIQSDSTWGGIGLRVEARGFQWNNPQARDAIFWEYNIANISNYDLPEVCFGYWVDNAIGGDGADDEVGYFNDLVDMSYSWDDNGIGIGGLTPGIMGFAYLESPGISYDGVDNDLDGIIDEKRNNIAENFVGPTDGIDDLSKFLEFYKITETELKSHWDADEDQDWENGYDENQNGTYSFLGADGNWYLEVGETAGNDVGLDGVGPTELNYRGPDEGEGNGRPDYDESLGCEPNFAATDVTESDMVGLTSFQLFPIFDQHPAPPGTPWFRNDDVMWDLVSSDSLTDYYGTVANLVELFASGPFSLYQGNTERISMAELHSYDPIEGLSSSSHSAPALFKLKTIVQTIYEKDYRFAQPPKMPTLSATTGDGYVMLTWDDDADKKTRDPFLGNINDFEGYKLFRSTDKYFSDAEVITDGYGTPMFLKPIFQCDLDDEYSGFTEYGLVNGAAYNLGDNTGIQHYFRDENVQNGRTYYYAIVAYDYGAPDIGPGISPSENTTTIDVDEYDQVRGYGQNVVIVMPHADAAGYNDPTAEIDSSLSQIILGTGEVNPIVAARGQIVDKKNYGLIFKTDTVYTASNRPSNYNISGLEVIDLTNNNVVYDESPTDNITGQANYVGENLLYSETSDSWSMNNTVLTDVFDGIQLEINQAHLSPVLDIQNTGWVGVQDPKYMGITITTRESKLFPYDCEIVFTDQPSYTTKITTPSGVYDEFDTRLWFPNHVLIGDSAQLYGNPLSFNFHVVNKSILDKNGNYTMMDLVAQDYKDSLNMYNQTFNISEDRILVGIADTVVSALGDTSVKWLGTSFIIDFFGGDISSPMPNPGDRYAISWDRQFWSTDTIKFSVKVPTEIEKSDIKEDMKKIKVVPNPYVGTNAMEESVINPFLNQPRKIMFTNIPSQCEVFIFTSSGVKVKTLNVNNSTDQGFTHWDLLNEEGLEIAAGMYIYYVKSLASGNQSVGKFAIIK